MDGRRASLVVICYFACGSSHALFLAPTRFPVERLVANTRSYLETHPDDSSAHYTLGRIHYLAFVNASLSLEAYWDKRKNIPNTLPDWQIETDGDSPIQSEARARVLKAMGYEAVGDLPDSQSSQFWEAVPKKLEELRRSGWIPDGIESEATRPHAAAALRSFRKAIELEPDNGLYHLGLASLIEQYRALTVKRNAATMEAFEGLGTNEMIADYLKAYELTIASNLTLENQPISLRMLVGYEAGRGFVWHVERGDDATRERYEEKLEEVKRAIAKLEALPGRTITPIVFSLEPTGSLHSRLAPDVTVCFDLDGDDSVKEWPWVQPSTAFLVWDPNGDGHIASGRQMLGSYTFRIFWENGYKALQALDDDRDGELSGAELDDLAAWFDSNQNGRSEPGEVMTCSELGIEAIATESRGVVDGQPMRLDGLRLADGSVRPTWDWITETYPTRD